MQVQVDATHVRAPVYRGRPDTILTLTNSGAVDVYVDSTPEQLNTVAPGAVPDETKVTKIAAGSAIIFSTWNGLLYARAASQTTLQVLAG